MHISSQERVEGKRKEKRLLMCTVPSVEGRFIGILTSYHDAARALLSLLSLTFSMQLQLAEIKSAIVLQGC